jgi:hypothetical protein
VTFSKVAPAVDEVVTISCAAVPGTYAIGSYQISFGDGQDYSGSAPATTHAWAAEGTKSVSCTAFDIYGLASSPRSALIDVGGPNVGPTVTTVSVTPAFPLAGTITTLTCSASAPAGRLVVGYEFDFGDSTGLANGPSNTATHAYAAIGSYPATCRAYDTSGRSGFLQRNVIVYAPSFPLTIGKIGSGSGLVYSTPSGLSCGSVCSGVFPTGTIVTLTALSAPGSRFAGWSGAGCSGVEPCSIQVTEAARVTANFLPEAGLRFVPVTPCRVADTRIDTGVPLAPGEVRAFDVLGSGCGVLSAAQAVTLNVTATEATAEGFLSIFPAGAETPVTQVVSFAADRTRAASVVIQLGVGGALSVYNASAGPAHVILDVNGAFQ